MRCARRSHEGCETCGVKYVMWCLNLILVQAFPHFIKPLLVLLSLKKGTPISLVVSGEGNNGCFTNHSCHERMAREGEVLDQKEGEPR